MPMARRPADCKNWLSFVFADVRLAVGAVFTRREDCMRLEPFPLLSRQLTEKRYPVSLWSNNNLNNNGVYTLTGTGVVFLLVFLALGEVAFLFPVVFLLLFFLLPLADLT